MRTKKSTIPGAEGYRELLQALEHDGKCIEQLTMEAVEKLDRMLDDELFNRTNLDSIQSLARESVVNVPALIDNKINHECGDEDNDNSLSRMTHLVIKCNERLEILVERVKHEAFLFTENAEKIRGLIDLNVMYNHGIDYEIQLSWKNELVQMQGQISSNHMEILTYYRDRSENGIHILKQPRISDYWAQLIEIDEDFFLNSERYFSIYDYLIFDCIILYIVGFIFLRILYKRTIYYKLLVATSRIFLVNGIAYS